VRKYDSLGFENQGLGMSSESGVRLLKAEALMGVNFGTSGPGRDTLSANSIEQVTPIAKSRPIMGKGRKSYSKKSDPEGPPRGPC
jgi:hypothetical protein